MVLIGGIIIDRIGTKKSTMLFGVICFVGAAVTAWPETPALAPLGDGRQRAAEGLRVACST